MIPPLPTSTLFPYTTLFRSTVPPFHRSTVPPFHRSTVPPFHRSTVRSEEHTSELQSRFDLVCRLLLEKKNVPPPPGSGQAATMNAPAQQQDNIELTPDPTPAHKS